MAAEVIASDINDINIGSNVDGLDSEEENSEIYWSEEEEYVCLSYRTVDDNNQLNAKPLLTSDLYLFDPLLSNESIAKSCSPRDGQSPTQVIANLIVDEPKTAFAQQFINQSEDTVLIDIKTPDKDINTGFVEPMIRQYHKCLSDAFNNPMVSDMRFIVENKSIYCNKTILKIRCKEFWQICDQNMIIENEIPINAYSYDTFNAFLMYLYGLRPEVNDQNCTELLKLAKEYDQRELKDICFQYLMKYVP
ncbi:unnamed protein product [Medioppia subpectinata]|uniref:BTB domain-containing protein n=1 Tax=Medioppia subpectinata TaxID=1979941 RepID=A0A7R9LUE7_9ACAR|nr:unnamed protein product [Medioppia subpectinata]CAG2121802.1 unnamed protein product [Medioppia subpectinata]